MSKEEKLDSRSMGSPPYADARSNRPLPASDDRRNGYPLGSCAVFTAPIMTCIAHVALAVPRFVCVEVVKCLVPTRRHRSGVTMTRIIAVVNVAVKAVRTTRVRRNFK
jgi:hypothetical protein